MGTRDTLLQRPDVPNEDIDDIIAIAARLQDEAEAEADRATVQEVEAVAAELDIDPRHVQAAIDALARERAEAEQAEDEAEETAAQTRRTLGRVGLIGAASFAALVGLVGIVVGALVVSADAGMDAAKNDLERAQTNLETVLDRQASLAPQLVALAGGDAGPLSSQATALKDAEDIPAKLEASDALGIALSTQLGQLPDTVSEQARSDLRHEVSGTTNRITVERRRYEEARVAYDQSRQGWAAGLARTVGLHAP